MNMNGFYEQIDTYFAEKDFAGAEQFMLQTLEQAETEQDDAAVITACNELGGFYRAFSRYSEGIPLYQKALSSLKRLGMENTDAHGTTLINFATTLTLTGDSQEALDAYTKAAAIFSGPSYAADYRLATLYNNMSSLYQSMDQLVPAEAYLYLALEILEKLSDSEIERATTLSNLAGVYLAMEDEDRLEDARNAAESAIALFQSVSGDSDVHFAAAVTVLGDVCYREYSFEEAEKQFRKAMNLTRRDYGEENLGYAILCENLAQTLNAMGRNDEAESLSVQASGIRERITP